MSLSIDDLVSSFSSSHIGQEGNDLAALQAQLAEAFFAASTSFATSSRYQTSPYSNRGREPCTTPTARSPTTSSFNWGDLDAGYRSRSSSISNRGATGYEDVEEEMMVEELLVPASEPSSMSSSSSAFENAHFIQRAPSHSYHQRTPSLSAKCPASPPSSHFTACDPFYLQAQANAQSYFYDNSNITQNGQPSLSSPFVAAAAAASSNQYQFHHRQPHSAMEIASGF